MSRPMSDTKTSFLVSRSYLPSAQDHDQERNCAMGKHRQPLYRGQCESCGEFDIED